MKVNLFVINYLFISIFRVIIVIIPLLIAVAYLTLAERKVFGAMQKRKGPNIVGLFGLLQPLADGLKLLMKEIILPSFSNKKMFIFAPILTFSLAIVGWAVIPFDFGVVVADINFGILYLFAVSSLGVYGVIISGWASNSRYAFLGAMRSAAQMISYEVSFGLVLISILICVKSLNFSTIVLFQKHVWFILPFFPIFFMFLVSILAETNRPPFDLPEAEAELVAGYSVEYSSIIFALFFLGEYANIIIMSILTTLIFFGGWLSIAEFLIPSGVIWLIFKSLIIIFIFIWIRAIVPRYRYDQLMRLGWKVFLPLSFAFVIITSIVVFNHFWYILF